MIKRTEPKEGYLTADRGREARGLAEEIEHQLVNVDYQSFSPQAKRVLQLKVSEYVESLTAVAAMIARHGQADIVSAAHVEQANQFLVTTSKRRWERHAGAVGILLLGSALTSFYSMISSNHYSREEVFLSVVFAIAGAAGYTYHIIRD